MKKIILRSAYYTDHATKQTAVAMSVPKPDGKSTSMLIKTGTETYGQQWLKTLATVLTNLPEMESGDICLSLVSGQPQCVLMAEKIVRMFILMLKLNDGTPERVKSIVMADGKYKRLPNDPLYEAVLEKLWVCRQTLEHFSLEQHSKPSPEAAKVFNAARKAASKSSL